MSDLMRAPQHKTYDVIIIGGAIMGSSTAWFLSKNSDFDGRILVVERDPTYTNASTSHTNSCIRQQFSTPLNVQISQFGADFINNIRRYMGGDERVPHLSIRSFGYMYLADTDAFAQTLRANQKVQHAEGAVTELLTPDDIKARYPFYNVDDVLLGSINTVNEGYWDGATVFDWWKRQAKEQGAEYLYNEVTAINRNAAGTQVQSVTLKTARPCRVASLLTRQARVRPTPLGLLGLLCR